LRDHLPLAKDVLQEIMPTPRENDMLKRLSPRRRALVIEKSRLQSRLQSDLHAACHNVVSLNTLDVTSDQCFIIYKSHDYFSLLNSPFPFKFTSSHETSNASTLELEIH